MEQEQKYTVTCTQFEELLTDYLDKTLESGEHKAVAAHALSCPLCHALLNDVKESLAVCREISAPAPPMARLEARILSKTAPQTAMPCRQFEDLLTDYLDGFLPAASYHRWERHAAMCSPCSDLPGMVVRSIAACYTYKTDELAVPAGLHQRILQATIGTAETEPVSRSWWADASEWVRGLRFPIAVPQLAPVAMILAFAFLMFGETVYSDGTIAGVYQKSFELAGQTYRQSADAWAGKKVEPGSPASQEPVTGTYVNNEDKK